MYQKENERKALSRAVACTKTNIFVPCFHVFCYCMGKLFLMQGHLFVHQFIEGKLITNWKNWENKYVELVLKESSFKIDINFIFCLTSSTDKYYVAKR